MSNSMRELGGLVDNLYISSQQKNRHPQDLPGIMASKNRQDATSTPSRARKMKVWVREKVWGEGLKEQSCVRAGPTSKECCLWACGGV